jgi:hypothetical protein
VTTPSFETDREKSPLMKALHELGLAHGVRLTVVATPIDGGQPHTLLIDHKDDTTKTEAVQGFVNAGVLLILAAGRLSGAP